MPKQDIGPLYRLSLAVWIENNREDGETGTSHMRVGG